MFYHFSIMLLCWIIREKCLPGDARGSPVRAAGSLRAVSTVIKGPQGSWAVWWWRGPSGGRALAWRHPPWGGGASWRRPGERIKYWMWFHSKKSSCSISFCSYDQFTSSHFTCDHLVLPSRTCQQAEVLGQWWWRWRYHRWCSAPPSGPGGSSAPRPSSGPVPGTRPSGRSGHLQSIAGPTALHWWSPSPSGRRRWYRVAVRISPLSSLWH